MIYLIAGPPRCGKTTIAKKLSKSWISADTIESMIQKNTSSVYLDKLFPKNFIRKKTKHGNDIMYSSYAAKQIVSLYKKQAKVSAKAIEAMVECEIRNGHDYVIEGHQLQPKLISKLVKIHGKSNIKPIVLTRFNLDEIVSGCLKNKAKYDWFIQKTKDPETYHKIAKMIKVYSEFFQKESELIGLQIVNMDGDFSSKIDEAVRLLKNMA